MKNVIIILALAICLIGTLSACGVIPSRVDLSDVSGPCVKNAIKTGEALAQGYEVRYGHGTFKGASHMWCEFKDPESGLWLMTKDTIWYVSGGYPVEAYKSGDKYDYHIVWYGYKGYPDEENEARLRKLGLMGN